MVAKISYGSSLYGALSYNFEKVDREQAKILDSNKISYHRGGNIQIASAMVDFNLLLKDNIRTEKPVIHISLNPHPDDKLDDDTLAKI